MNYELKIPIGERNVRIFLQDGFFSLGASVSTYHRHRYPEAHIIVSGEARYDIDGDEVNLKAGEMYVIPPKVFHRCVEVSEGAERLAFMAESEATGFGKRVPMSDVIKETVNAVKRGNGIGNARIYACLSALCSEFLDGQASEPVPVSDRGFIIHEFFSNNYHRDINISEIADILHLSEKQTQRMIKHYTGNDFRTELTHRRMEAAQRFIESADMSLGEIAERVGYKSYSGFWKAFKAWQKRSEKK